MGSLSRRGVVVLIPKKADLPSEILPALIERYKTTRLTALQLDPSAFGSNYAREIQFTYETWLSRATNPLAKTFVSVGTSGPETSAENVCGSSNDPSIAPLLHEEWVGTITLFGPKVLSTGRRGRVVAAMDDIYPGEFEYPSGPRFDRGPPCLVQYFRHVRQTESATGRSRTWTGGGDGCVGDESHAGFGGGIPESSCARAVPECRVRGMHL